MKKRGTFTVISINTESGGRPHFNEAFHQIITSTDADIVALQEVHRAHSNDAPRRYQPINPGKREHPVNLRLFNELEHRYHTTYQAFFAGHVDGLHDLEACPEHRVSYGQMFLVHRRHVIMSWRSDFVYGQHNQYNTEASGGTPAGKVALGACLLLATKRTLAVSNVHGFWSQWGKKDMDARFAQNAGIATHLLRLRHGRSPDTDVLCVGDLNYRSDMEALEDLRQKSVFGHGGGVVLNHRFGVTRTRSNHYLNWPNEPEADFMISNQELADRVVDYHARLDFPSDHGVLIARVNV